MQLWSDILEYEGTLQNARKYKQKLSILQGCDHINSNQIKTYVTASSESSDVQRKEKYKNL